MGRVWVELLVIVVLLILAVGLISGSYRWSEQYLLFDILSKFGFALLVAVVSRLVMLGFSQLEKERGKELEAYRNFKNLGLVDVHAHLDEHQLRNRLARSRDIRVLKTWFPETKDIEDGLRDALLKNGASVQLLLCAPGSKLLNARSLSAHETENHGPTRVVHALRRMHEWVCEGSGKGRFEIGLYKGWPGCPIIIHDDTALLGFYLREQPSTRWPWLEVRRGSRMAQILKEQFKSVWDEEGMQKIKTCDELKNWLNSQGQLPAAD